MSKIVYLVNCFGHISFKRPIIKNAVSLIFQRFSPSLRFGIVVALIHCVSYST